MILLSIVLYWATAVLSIATLFRESTSDKVRRFRRRGGRILLTLTSIGALAFLGFGHIFYDTISVPSVCNVVEVREEQFDRETLPESWRMYSERECSDWYGTVNVAVSLGWLAGAIGGFVLTRQGRQSHRAVRD